jgi:putative Holliday junction resolvase
MTTPLPEKKKASRIIGIDYGMVRIGVAVSDPSKIIAMPFMTVRAERKCEQTVAKLLELLQQHQLEHLYEIAEIVIGLPLLLSGKKGLLADEVNHFVDELKQHVTFPITTWDERLTSVQADRSMRESSMSRKKRAQKVDTVAAVIILQNYLDYLGIRMRE